MLPKIIQFFKKKRTQRRIAFVLRHLVYASVLYYLLALSLDILTQGLISRLAKPPILLAPAIAATLLLPLLPLSSSFSSRQTFLLLIILLLLAALLFLAFSPHDPLLAGVVSIIFLIFFASTRKSLLPSLAQ